jgi:hypothetical protein
VSGTVHVPDTWGGWRIHPEQATAVASMASSEHAARVDSMIEHAVETCRHELDPAIRDHLTHHWLRESKEVRAYLRRIAACRSDLHFAAVLAAGVIAGAAPAREHVGLRLRGRSMHDWIARRLERIGVRDLLVPLARSAAPAAL